MDNEMKWTKEPWRVAGPDDDPYGDILIVGGTERRICRLWQDDAPVHDYNAEQWANATRIVACVNACQGVPSPQPGSVAIALAAMKRARDEIENCRLVDLVTTCKKIIGDLDAAIALFGEVGT